MKKICLLSSVLIAGMFANMQAQTFTLYGDKTFGGNLREWCATSPMLKTGSNHFILSGNSHTNVNGDKTDPNCLDSLIGTLQDIWIVKTDANFNILWDKSFGGSMIETPSSIIWCANGNILFASISNSDSSCEKTEHSRGIGANKQDYWLCMLDSNGNKLWDKTLGGSVNEGSPQVIQLNSGNIIVAGVSLSLVSGDKTVANYGGTDYWVVKLDSMGNKLWDKVYGGTSAEYVGISSFDGTKSLSLLKEGAEDFILAGTTESPQSGSISDTSRGLSDAWLIKLDSAGNKIWDKRYGGSGRDYGSHIVHSNDNGYIVLGSSNSPQGMDVSDTSRGFQDFWVLKLDSLGNKQWDKKYGGNSFEEARWIEAAPGGGYWLSGNTLSDSGGDVSEPNYGTSISTASDYWIVKIDSLGNKLWDKRFGIDGRDQNSNFIIMADSSIVMFGSGDSGTSVVKTDTGKGNWDYWLVHFKYDDNTTAISNAAGAGFNFTISANPTKSETTITSPLPIKSSKLLTVTGSVAFSKENVNDYKITLDVKELPQGIYFVEVQTEKGVAVKKLVKM